MAKRRFTYSQPSFQNTVPVNQKYMYCKNKIAIKPPEVAKMCSIEVGSPILPWNRPEALILKELDKKNKKKNGKYIGRT